MNVYYKEILNNVDFNHLLAGLDKSIISLPQTGFYYNWQVEMNRKGKRFLFYKSVDGKDIVVGYIQLFKYNLIKKYNYYYAPLGPIVWEYSKELILSINEMIEILNSENDIVFSRLDFNKEWEDININNTIKDIKWKKISSALEHSSFLQPRAEIIVPINKMGEDIINNFNKDVRYNIRSSEKKGVVNEIVKEDFNKYIDIFMSIISETTKRNKFNFHDKKYLEIIFNSLENIKNGFLSLSYVSGTVIGVGMYIIYNNNSFYLFAGSKTGYRKYLPGYSNIYSAIKYISENGLANNLSLGGISSTNHPNNNLKLLTEFKSDWSNSIREYNKCYDVVAKKYLYNLYKIYKRARE